MAGGVGGFIVALYKLVAGLMSTQGAITGAFISPGIGLKNQKFKLTRHPIKLSNFHRIIA